MTYTHEQIVTAAGADQQVAGLATRLADLDQDTIVTMHGALVLRRGDTYCVAWERGTEVVSRRLGADAEGGALTAKRTPAGIDYVSERYSAIAAARWIWMESHLDDAMLALAELEAEDAA